MWFIVTLKQVKRLEISPFLHESLRFSSHRMILNITSGVTDLAVGDETGVNLLFAIIERFKLLAKII